MRRFADFKIRPFSKKGRRNIHHNDIQHNDIQHYDIQHNDTQHGGIIFDTQHNGTQYNINQYGVPIRWVFRVFSIVLSVFILNDFVLRVVMLSINSVTANCVFYHLLSIFVLLTEYFET
jgi:hypothetical protein